MVDVVEFAAGFEAPKLNPEFVPGALAPKEKLGADVLVVPKAGAGSCAGLLPKSPDEVTFVSLFDAAPVANEFILGAGDAVCPKENAGVVFEIGAGEPNPFDPETATFGLPNIGAGEAALDPAFVVLLPKENGAGLLPTSELPKAKAGALFSGCDVAVPKPGVLAGTGTAPPKPKPPKAG